MGQAPPRDRPARRGPCFIPGFLLGTHCVQDDLGAGRGKACQDFSAGTWSQGRGGGGGGDPHAGAAALPSAAGGKEGQDSQQQEMHTPTLFSSNHQEKLRKEKTHAQVAREHLVPPGGV